MAFDLAISEFNDLLFMGNNDLALVFGNSLIEQRIRLRLKIIRGSWIYDTSKTLGSDLRQILHETQQSAASKVEPIVRQALLPMKDIRVQSVDVFQGTTEREIIIRVNYSQTPSPGVAPGVQPTVQQVEFPVSFQP